MTRRDDGLPQPRKPAFAWLSQRISERVFLLNQHRRQRRVRHLRQPLRDRAALLEMVREKHLVFTVTAGRTGTTYVTRLGELFPDTVSVHEPQPSYVHVLRQIQRRPRVAYDFLLEYKLPFIAAAPASRYLETSHLVGKGFLEPLLDLGLRPSVLMLRREPRAIARSLLTRRTVPGRGKLGFKYLIHPGDPGVLPLSRWTSYSDTSSLVRARGWSAAACTATADRQGLRDRRCHTGLRPRPLHPGGQSSLRAARCAHRSRDAAAPARGGVRTPLQPTTAGRRRGGHTGSAEEAVWHAITPAAPWLREAIERRYAPAAEVTPLVASRS